MRKTYNLKLADRNAARLVERGACLKEVETNDPTTMTLAVVIPLTEPVVLFDGPNNLQMHLW